MIARVLAPLLALAPAIAGAQAPRTLAERYDRAARLMVAPATAAVRNESVVPHWIGATDRFWYLRQTARGAEFVTVDAATGETHAAFDAPALARALSPLLKTAVAPDTLPFAEFAYDHDGSAITFGVGADRYRCTLATAACRATAVPAPDLLVSPDGSRAVLSRDGDLYLRDMASGVERRLTRGGTPDRGWGIVPEPSDFHALRRAPGAGLAPFWTFWSPDGRRLITSFTDQSYVAPYPYVDYVPADGSFRPKAHSIRLALTGERPPFTRLAVLDVDTGATRPVGLDSTRIAVIEIGARLAAWTADSAHWRLFAGWADQRGASLYEVDAAAGTLREVIREPGVNPALLNAGGYGAANVALVNGGRQAIWSSQRSGWPHLYLYDVATGRPLRQLTRGAWVVRELLRADDRLRRVFFVGQGREGGNPYHRSVYSVGYDGRGLRRLTPEAADVPIANPRTTFPGFTGEHPYDPVSADGRYIVYSYSGLAEPAVTMLRRTDGTGPARTVERADAGALFALGYRPPAAFTAKAADGRTDLYGVIYRPSDYDPRRRYPVLLAQYNSPLVVVTPRNFASGYSLVHDNATPAAEAELGFIVVAVDPRGTPFRGAAFSNPPIGWLADMGLTDQAAVLRALAARDPSMDLSRVGIAGASFGGWTAIRALIRHNDLFKAGVAWASPGSFHSLYVADTLTASLGPATYAGGSTLRKRSDEAPESWAAADSIAQVGELRGRLLVGTGGLDENVVPGSQLQFLQAAALADKDVEQIFIPSATHGPIPGWSYVVKRIWDFWARTLLNETPPTDYTFPAGTFPAGRPKR